MVWMVLILVVVEDVLVLRHTAMSARQIAGLNPCCGGRCSSTFFLKKLVPRGREGLNPCCGGRCSSTHVMIAGNFATVCLNPCCGGRCSSTPIMKDFKKVVDECLNPCCGGRCSSTPV